MAAIDLNAFEEKLFDSLKKFLGGEALERTKILGVAVSGGADSVSLLCSLAALRDFSAGGNADNEAGECKPKRRAANSEKPKRRSAFPKIVCVTVDHSIRPEVESSGDAAFVQALCQKLGVECFVKKIERGVVQRLADQRGKGLEEAARFLRYQKFEEFAKESGAEYICLAHNQNDALETLLMRFFQGSAAAYGIAPQRGIYLRPLLETSRPQIEEYLRSKKIEWRTDSSNQDNSYLRNKVRNLLIPFLDQNFEGWKKALLAGGEKAALESEALDGFLEQALAGAAFPLGKQLAQGQNATQAQNATQGQNAPAASGLEIAKDFFEPLPAALRQRYLYRAFDDLALEERVPYSFVRSVAAWPEKDFKKIAAAGLEAVSKKDKVFLKILKKEATESGFFDIIVGKENASEVCVERTRAVGDKI